MSDVHSTAIIGPKVTIGKNVEIGPYSIIEGETDIGDNTKIMSHCHITGYTKIGSGNVFYPYSSIGFEPKDLKFKGEKSYVEIGNNNVFREYTNVCRATSEDGSTKIGNNNLLMTYVSIAHGCRVGNNVIMANLATLGGHVHISDYARIGGVTALHQFVKVGQYAILGAGSKANMDIPPFTVADGMPARLYGINVINLKRNGFKLQDIKNIKQMYKTLFYSADLWKARLALIENEFGEFEYGRMFLDFIKNSSRGIAHPPKKGANEE